MNTDTINIILREASALSVSDLAKLAHKLLLRAKRDDKSTCPRWRDVRGKATPSKTDAQHWISAQRHESDAPQQEAANGSRMGL